MTMAHGQRVRVWEGRPLAGALVPVHTLKLTLKASVQHLTHAHH